MGKILVTTTSTIEGYEITKYHGYISANFVTSADFINDFFAGFTDFFGGVSGSYTNEVDALKAMAVDSLEIKAEKMGMNAIIGLQVDMEPIFGGNVRSMFMVSSSGTAVYVEGLNEELTEEEKNKKELLRKIKALSNIQSITNEPNKFSSCTANELEAYLIALGDEDASKVVEMFIEYCKEPIYETIKTNIQSRKKIIELLEYLKRIPKENYMFKLDGTVTKEKAKAMKLLGLISYSNLLNELKLSKGKEYDIEIISILSTSPEIIEEDDSKYIGEIIEVLQGRYKGDVEIKKVGMINKKDMWLCPKCKSPIELSDSKCSLCLVDKYGLPSNLKYDSKLTYLKSLYNILVKSK